MSAKKVKQQEGLAQRASGMLSRNTPLFTIGSLERALLKRFPASDAESWDKTGLVVGDRTQSVKKIALALDPTVTAIRAAKAQDANVLITHHPAFIEAPASFEPEESKCLSPGAGVWAAIEEGVALLSFHTALDVSTEAAKVLPSMLKLSFQQVVQPIKESKKGYGQLCSPSKQESPFTLGTLAARCTAVFGRAPRVWGDFSSELDRIVTCTGNATATIPYCLEHAVDCVVCGEIRYHDALDLSLGGVAVVDLGHDVSELPLVAVLGATLSDIGVNKKDVIVIDQQANWSYPETTRM